MHLSSYEIFEIIAGLTFLWVSIYLVSKNPTNFLSWIVFFFLASIGSVQITDPILIESRNLAEYIIWQKVTSWPLFFSPVFYYHASVLTSGKRNKITNFLIYFGYAQALIFFIAELHGGLVLREDIIRLTNYKRFDGFAAGVLMLPSVGMACIYALLGTVKFFKQTKTNFIKFFFPAFGGAVYTLTGILTIIGYYALISWADVAFMLGITAGAGLIVVSLIRFHLVSASEKVFGKDFLYKTIGIAIILLIYISGFKVSGLKLSFESLVLFVLLLFLVIFTHSFYDWLSTFINDFLFNPMAGLSVVNDQEVYSCLRNFHVPQKLENSTLLRLHIIKNKKTLAVDSLRETIKEAIEYFKPESEPHRRIKKNLKYYLLKMLVFDEAEEGQILWELGFEEYPVKVMSQERKYRPPLFETKSPSDYTYTSRNAFLALKKEAIHDITWRISYLEKQKR